MAAVPNLLLPYTSRRSIEQDGVAGDTKAWLTEVFHRADADCKGFLTRDDYKVALVAVLGYKPTKFELERTARAIDFDKKELTLEAFLKLLSSNRGIQDLDDEIRRTFLAIDTECKGFITLKDIIRVFQKIAPSVRRSAFVNAFDKLDADLDGRMGYRDFEAIMRHKAYK
ncbi:EF-hand calcium-binding domain-containing protein 11 [Gaertneriomyces sp. JEL0708]|nr:EF-hand calcium-binding domain-containing protein 11 [Gaertneriomyces sp. JEL0708]